MVEVYLVTFWVGLILTLIVSLFGGFGHGGHASVGVHLGHTQIPGTGHGPGPFNLTTILGFLTGFGGCGYVLSRLGFAGGVFVLVLAVLVGLVIAALLFFVLVKVVAHGERVMHERDYDLQGMLGYISIPVPADGVGEMKYVLEGTTRSLGVRSVNGRAIAKQTEVVITSVEKGIGWVAPYDEYVHGQDS